MKGINAISTENDPGQNGFSGVNATFAKDLAAFSLNYFNNDYSPINASAAIASVDNSSHAANNSSQLFNGNIRYMQTRLTHPNTRAAMPMLNAYKYDQLNRLSESRSYESGLNSSAWNPTTYANEYYNAFTFDGMGNILTQKRHKRDGTAIEDMTYRYQYEDPTNQQRLMRNRLFHINDAIAANVDATDIDDMGTFDADVEDINVNNNYSYDEEGRLVRDNQEGISKIVWRVDGKVKEIQRTTGDAKWLKFDYDAMGHRIAKHVYNNTGITLEKSTYYILDAQGNQVSMYEHVVENETVKYNLVENNIFGSSRIGNLNREMNVLNASISSGGTKVLGKKFYEFTNHLGNVLTVFSNLKIPQDTDNNNLVDNYLVGIVRSVDYSPFGVELDGRTIAYEPPTVSNGSPTIIYQHKFDDSPSTHPYTTSPDQLDANLTNVSWTNTRNSWTNYGGHTGRAIAINSASADTTKLYLNLQVNSGYLLDVTSYSFYHRSSSTGYTNYKLYINNILIGNGSIFVSSGSTLQHTGTVNVANAIAGLSGNITVRFDLFGGSNGSNGTFRLDNFTLNGYTTTEEDWNPRGYRYGFQNQEKNDKISGNGNSYTADFWQYDSRSGRRWNLDPVFKEHESPYACFANNPIWFVDPNGADSTISNFNSSWKWTVEGGDTYESISKRTNVKESKLRRLNKNQNLEVGDVIKLSNKKGEINLFPGSEIKTPQGNIYLEILAENTSDRELASGLIYLLTFIPNDNECEYLWYQTIASNYPKETFVWQENDNARADDGTAGMNYGVTFVRKFENEKGDVFREGIFTYDGPKRPFLKGKTTNWRANIQLIEKTDNSYIVIATFQVPFKIHSIN